MTVSAGASLAGALVLVPRRDPADPFAAAVAAAGGRPLCTALVRTAVIEPPDELDDALRALASGAHAWLAVTSARAVEVLATRAAAMGTTLAELASGTRVAAVGPATAAALAAEGVVADLCPDGESSAAALAAAWPAGQGLVLFPRSELAAPTLGEALLSRGWLVDDVVAYRTLPASEPDPDIASAISSGDVDAVLLTSTSTASALVTLYGVPPATTRVCVIGNATADGAARAGLRVDAVAAAQTPEGLVAAAARALSSRTATPKEHR